MRLLGLFLLLPLAASGGEVFTSDGVTDGDTFYLAPAAHSNNEPVYQSWVAYSLMKSACQLEIGGINPARANSFECELKSRRRLVEAWDQKKQGDSELTDLYLDALSEVQYSGFLTEYTAVFFAKKGWSLPANLRTAEFSDYRREYLGRHKAITRIIGSWNYREIVDAAMEAAAELR